MPLTALPSSMLHRVSAWWARVFRPRRKAHWLDQDPPPSSRAKNDTIAAWPPQAARVLTDAEAEALDLARRAAPRALVLAQVPLWRFVRVSSRQSYSRWLQRVGYINADLLVCDAQGTVLAVVDVHREPMSERSQRRHERLRRVLRATGTPVLTWQQERLPSMVKVRAQFRSHGVDCSDLDDNTASPPPRTMAQPMPANTTVNSNAPGSGKGRPRAPVHEAVSSDFHGLHTAPSTIL
jgi:hypothetical protein